MVFLISGRKRTTSFDKSEENEEIPVEHFGHQVGGHHVLTRADSLHLVKPVGERELRFYLRMPTQLAPLVPHLCGYMAGTEGTSSLVIPTTRSACPSCLSSSRPLSSLLATSSSSSDTQQMRRCSAPEAKRSPPKEPDHRIILSDLTSPFRRPCIVDLKMGTRQHGDEANEEKRRRQTEKCARSTSLQWGLRLCGLQYYDATSGAFTQVDKYEGRKIEVQALGRAIQGFLSYVDGRPRIGIASAVLRAIEEIEEVISNLDGLRLYGSSLLIVYEGDSLEEPQSDEEADKLVTVRVVDFANVSWQGLNMGDESLHSGADQGFVLGLHSLHGFVAQLLSPVPDSDLDSDGSMSP